MRNSNKKKNKKKQNESSHDYDSKNDINIKLQKNNPDDFNIPPEIDTHFSLYGKHVWEAVYFDKCPICGCNVDEYGFCGCGSGSE